MARIPEAVTVAFYNPTDSSISTMRTRVTHPMFLVDNIFGDTRRQRAVDKLFKSNPTLIPETAVVTRRTEIITPPAVLGQVKKQRKQVEGPIIAIAAQTEAQDSFTPANRIQTLVENVASVQPTSLRAMFFGEWDPKKLREKVAKRNARAIYKNPERNVQHAINMLREKPETSNKVAHLINMIVSSSIAAAPLVGPFADTVYNLVHVGRAVRDLSQNEISAAAVRLKIALPSLGLDFAGGMASVLGTGILLTAGLTNPVGITILAATGAFFIAKQIFLNPANINGAIRKMQHERNTFTLKTALNLASNADLSNYTTERITEAGRKIVPPPVQFTGGATAYANPDVNALRNALYTTP